MKGQGMNLRTRLVPISVMMLAAIAPVTAAVAQEASPVASPVANRLIGSLNFLGESDLSNLTMVDGTLVGGLSGIDYDPATGTYVVISDDKSQNNPARYYTAALDFGLDGFANAEITGETTLLQEDGTPYPGPDAGGDVPDPESIRFDPENAGDLWWTSEGDGNLGINPEINEIDSTGQYIGGITPPAQFDMHPNEESGSRHNLTFEGLTFAADGQSLYVAMESATYEDGPIATLDAGTNSRITQYDRDGNVLAQYAYPVDPIQDKPTGDGADNGLSEILAVDATHFLVVERSGVSTAEGPWTMHIRVYLVDISGATDISGIDSLQGADFTPVSKTLVLNLDDAGIDHVDNIEGITWGPTLENGNASIVLVSDNNFSEDQTTQFLAFEVLP